MVYLQVENLTKSFGDRLLFENISFGIDQGQRVALIAQNGTGKTTLLNLLTGRKSQDSGNITYRRDIRVGCLTQNPDFQPGMTVSQACFASDNDVVKAIAHYETLLSQLSSETEATQYCPPVLGGRAEGGGGISRYPLLII